MRTRSRSIPPDPACPEPVPEFGRRCVDYVEQALGLRMEYDSETLPVLDHFLRSVPADDLAVRDLIVCTSGAYFGEVVRKRLGGHWDVSGDGATDWRMTLPSGISFAPAGIAAAAIEQGDVEDLDCGFTVPPERFVEFETALEAMGEVTVEVYYSLCGRLDTLEQLEAVLAAMKAAGRDDLT